MSIIAENQVVAMRYVLKNNDGEILDQSPEGKFLFYLHGAKNILPGLEKALEGKTAGDEVSVSLTADEAYGAYNEEFIQEVPRDMFQGVDDVQPGMQFQANTPNGVQVVTIKSVDGDKVFVDANHPLAGVDLNFDVQIVEVREAKAEELEHGHPHVEGQTD